MPKTQETVDRIALKRIGITCVSFNLRKASRIVTNYFDTILAPSGLRSTQFHILASIGRHENLPISDLADILVMDRTTLTRNLRPLEKKKLIRFSRGKDKRTREIILTPLGYSSLSKAIPLWNEAQTGLLERMGEQNGRGLLMNLWRFIYGKRFLNA